MKKLWFTLCLCLPVACGTGSDDRNVADAALALADDIPPGTPLDEMLTLLDQHLVAAMSGQLEGDARAEFHRAEAITDRLLEARLPFEWLGTQQYSLGARLRQVQSSADRIMARLVTATRPDTELLADLRSLRAEVAALRQAVADGGSPAPPALSELLAADSSRPRIPGPDATPIRTDTASGNRPLGSPVNSGG